MATDFNQIQNLNFGNFTSSGDSATITVADQDQLNQVIDAYNNLQGGTLEIDVDPGVVLTQAIANPSSGDANQAIDSIDNSSGASLTVKGANPGGTVITGLGNFSGFVVETGQVSFQELDLEAMAGAGTPGLGALAALGGANVTLDAVEMTGNTSSTGFGGDIYVAPDASVSANGGGVTAGQTGDGSGLFVDGGTLTLGAGNASNQETVISGIIADGTSKAGLPSSLAGHVVVGDGSTDALVYLDPYTNGSSGAQVPADNLYTGGTIFKSGTLILAGDGSAGTGAITFGSGTTADTVDQTLIVNAVPAVAGGTSLPNVLKNFGFGDVVDIADMPFASDETVRVSRKDPRTGQVTVTVSSASDGQSESFQFQNPQALTYKVSQIANGTISELTLLKQPFAGGGGGGGAGGGTPTPTPPAPTPPTPTPPVISPVPTNNGSTLLPGPVVAFDPSITVSGTAVTMTGTVSAQAGVTGVEIFQGTAADPNRIDLGAATVRSDGTWTLTLDLPSGYRNNLEATASDKQGLATTALSYYDLTTNVQGQAYTTVQDSYDPALFTYTAAYPFGFEGEKFFKADGSIYLASQFSPEPNGGVRYDYTSGSFFDHTNLTSFVDSYDVDNNLTTHVETHDNGSHFTEIVADGQVVQALGADTFANNAAIPTDTRFVFHHGVGAETIDNFHAAGAAHDTIDLQEVKVGAGSGVSQHKADALKLAHILTGAKSDAQGDTTINIGRHDTITFAGVSVAALQKHAGDFTFHA